MESAWSFCLIPMFLWDLAVVGSGVKVKVVPCSALASIIPLKLFSSAIILGVSMATAFVETIQRNRSDSRCAIASVQCQLRKIAMSGMVLMYRYTRWKSASVSVGNWLDTAGWLIIAL